ncbi:MAG: RNA methyltransferase [Pseudomonadota bacterium]
MTKPSIILVEPQLGENIGASARAMLNFGLDELAIVKPRDGWPNARADAMSSGALDKMPPVQVFENTATAIKNCHYIYATTARPRDMVKPVFTAAEAAADMRKREAQGQKIGILFGGERTGLHNDDVARAHAIITIPTNPDFSSLNLGQGVIMVAYEYFQSGYDGEMEAQAPAPQGEFDEFVARLETELDELGFFRSPDMKPNTLRNIRSMLLRTELTSQEIKTWHGIVSALIGKKVSK